MNFGRFVKLVFIMVATFICIVTAGGVIVHAFNLFPQDGSISFLNLLKQGGTTAANLRGLAKGEERIHAVVMGVDADQARADFIMLASYNVKDRTASVLSIPRDTKVDTGRADKKINSAYVKGDEKVILDEIKVITGIEARYFVVVDFKAFRNIVNSVGGIKMDVPMNMIYDDPYQNLHIYLLKGPQVLNGEKAEQFVRFRMNNDGSGYPGGDVDRIKAQQVFLEAAIDQVVNPKNIIKLPQIIKTVSENVSTNIRTEDIGNFIKIGLGVKKENIHFYCLPGEGKYINGISYYIYDKQKTNELIKNSFLAESADSPASENSWLAGALAGAEKALSMNGTPGAADGRDKENDGQGKEEKGNRPVRVEVLNATDYTGLASKVAQNLKKNGYDVVKIGNYNTNRHVVTRIIERNESKAGSGIQKILRLGTIENEMDPSRGVDVTVILGDDFE